MQIGLNIHTLSQPSKITHLILSIILSLLLSLKIRNLII